MTIELLEASSIMIGVFEDPKPVDSIDDSRLHQLDVALAWFTKWEESVMSMACAPGIKGKMLLSDKLRFDLSSMVFGFKSLCAIVIANGGSVVPATTNSNIVENIFCQQRGHNGQNTNPNYYQYCHTMNGIILGQRTTTKKCNTGNGTSFPFFVNKKLVRK
jgi:hypothetical protein